MSLDEPKAIRLSFSYKGGKIKLEDAQPLSKVVPPTEPIEDDRRYSGFWFELHGSSHEVLYRQSMFTPISFTQEIFPSKVDEPIIREPIRRPAGVFSVVVPFLEAARTLVLYSSPLQPSKKQQTAAKLAEFDLPQLSSGGGTKP